MRSLDWDTAHAIDLDTCLLVSGILVVALPGNGVRPLSGHDVCVDDAAARRNMGRRSYNETVFSAIF